MRQAAILFSTVSGEEVVLSTLAESLRDAKKK